MSCLSFGHNPAGSRKPALTSQRCNIAEEDWIQSWRGKLDANLEDFCWSGEGILYWQQGSYSLFLFVLLIVDGLFYHLLSFLFLLPILVISVFIAHSPLFPEHPIIWADTTRLVTHKQIFIVSTCFLAQFDSRIPSYSFFTPFILFRRN